MKRLEADMRLRGALLACVGLATACTRGAQETPDADHDHSHAAAKASAEHGEHDEDAAEPLDAHHAAFHARACENDVRLTAEAVARYGIEVGPAEARPLRPTVSAPGHLAFPQGAIARVGAPVEGRIAEIRVRTGDTVAQGDVLLVIESAELGESQSDFLQKRTLARSTGPAVELAQGALSRAQELYDRVQGIALSEVQSREAELRAAERERDVTQAAFAAAASRLRLLGLGDAAIRALEESGAVEPRLSVAAPLAGRVVELAATIGELVGPQKDRLVVVGDARTLWAIAEVSESRLAEVALGAPALVRVPALGERSCAGAVAAVATALEASTRTAEVRVAIPNPDGAMLPGMFVQVEIESSVGAGAPVLSVPDAAVLTIEGRASVFVPLEPGASAFCVHEVEVGAPVGDYVPILSGLQPGEIVVVAGTFRLKAEHGKGTAEHQH